MLIHFSGEGVDAWSSFTDYGHLLHPARFLRTWTCTLGPRRSIVAGQPNLCWQVLLSWRRLGHSRSGCTRFSTLDGTARRWNGSQLKPKTSFEIFFLNLVKQSDVEHHSVVVKRSHFRNFYQFTADFWSKKCLHTPF